MALVETPDDAAMQTRRTADGLLVAGPSWDSQRRRFGYERRMRYVFLEKGGHVAMAKRYRAYAKEKGLLVTFAEKAKSRPRVLDLVGAPNVWCWGGNEMLNEEILGEIRGAGAEKVLWSAGGSPTARRSRWTLRRARRRWLCRKDHNAEDDSRVAGDAGRRLGSDGSTGLPRTAGF